MVLTANLSTLVPNLVETDALTNVFTITLTDGDLGLPAQVITVNYVISGTALAGTDYTALTGSVNINIPANTATGSAIIQIDPIDDLQIEGTETLTLTLAEDPGTNTQPYVLGTTQTSSTIAIVDDLSASETSLLPQISVVASDPITGEIETGIATASFTFTRSNADATNPLTVYFTVTGTATPDPDPSTTPDDSGDYVQTTLGSAFTTPPNSSLPSTSSITFAANQTAVTVSFNAIDDAVFDPDESVTITILPSNLVVASPADQYTIGTSSATATIADNEVAPLVSITPVAGTIDEGGVQTFTISLDNGPIAEDLFVEFNIGGTATNPNLLEDANNSVGPGADDGDDFFVPELNVVLDAQGNLLTSTPRVLIQAGQSSVTFTVRTVSDGEPLNDDNETVEITLLDTGTSYDLGATGSATLNVRDLDNQGQVSITPGTSLAIEGGTTASFTLTRTGYNLDQVVVPFTLTGSATSLTDYTLAVTSGNATIDLANQTITLNAVAGAPADGTTQTVTVQLTAVLDGVVDSVIGDGTENVTLTLTDSPTGLYTLGTSNSTGEIRIDDVDILQLPTVTIEAGRPPNPNTNTQVSEEETNTGNYGVFTLTRTGGNSLQFPLTVAYTITGSATNGSDFNTLTGTVTFLAGVATAEVVIAPLDDSTFEGTESVTLTLADPVAEPPQYVLGAADSATIAITEIETANTSIPRITILATDPTAEEVNSVGGDPLVVNPGVFTVFLEGTITSALTVNYTIGGSGTAGVDYQALTGSIVFDVGGVTSKTIDVRAIDDLIAEPDETVNITISASPNYTIGQDAFAEVTLINNDDRGPFTVATTQALGIEGGQDARFTIDRATDLGATTVNFTLSGTATNGADYSVITLDGAGNEVVLSPELDGSYNITFTNATGTGTDLQRVILVRPEDDTQFEGLVNETVTLTLQTPPDSSYTLGTPIEGNASIRDNDAEVSISSTDLFLAEGGTGGIFTISRTSSDLTNALTVNYSISGTAANETDYQVLSGTATIAVGSNSIDIPVNIINDALVESSETLILNLNPGTGYAVSNNSSITFFIADNEPSVFVTATTDTVVEGAGNGVFTITRTGGDTSQDLTVGYTVTGTAEGSTDYALLPGTATILAGQTSVTVNVATFDDPVFEGSESVTLTIDSSTSYRATTTGSQSDTVTITDANDLLLETVSISATPSSVAENETNPANRSIFTITRNNVNGFANDLTVFYTISGSATENTDYDDLTGSVTIAAGQDSATIEIAPLDDLDFEGTESVTLTLRDPVQGPPQYIFGSNFTAGIAITDNETLPGALPEIEVTVNDPSADENDATDRAIFTFTRTGATDTELTVNYTIGGNATVGIDYQAITGTITFAVGEASRDLVVTAIDDLVADLGETVLVTINSNANYTIGTDSSAEISIADNDDRGPFTAAVVQDLAIEGGQDAVFTIDRAVDSGAVTVRFTLSGTTDQGLTSSDDYVVRNESGAIITGEGFDPVTGGTIYLINFTTGTGNATDLQRTITVEAVDDALFEGVVNETVVLTLQTDEDSSYTLGTTTIANASIRDNEAEVEVTSSGNPAEGGGSGIFTITRTSGDISQDLVVSYSLSGDATNATDYSNLTGTVTILANQTSAQVVLNPINDQLVEAPEQATLTLNAGTGYVVGGLNSASLFIDDNEPTISVTATTDTVVEGAGNGVFTITRANGDTTQDLVVNYTITGTATNGTDYVNLPGTVTIAAGQDEVTVNVVTIDNAVFEGTETVTLTIDNTTRYIVSGTNASDTVTITDANDLLLETVSISAAPGSVAENETDPATRSIFTITRDNANGFAEDLTVFYTISGSAVGGADYDTITGSVTIAAGQASATVEIAPLDDLDFEGTESVTLTLTDPVQSPPQYVFNNASAAATIAITDNDTLPGSLPQITVIANNPGASEVNIADPALFDRGQFTFVRTGATTSELTVNYTIAGTAEQGTDYQPIVNSGSITFAIGEGSKTIDITAIDDLIYDPNETVSVTISSNSNYTIGSSASSAIATITDNEVKPTVSLTASGTTLTEGGQAVIYTVTRTGSTGSPLTVSFVLTGNAQRTFDYNLGNTPSGSILESPDNSFITLAANQTTGTFQITAPLNAESLIDDGEQVILTLANSNDYDLAAQNSATITIRDRSDRGNINLSFSSSGNAQGTESSTNSDPVIFTLTRTGDNLQSVLVPFTFTGQADPGDYGIDIYRYDLDSSGELSTTRTKLTDAQELEFFNNASNFETLTSGLFKLPAFPSGTDLDPPLNSVTGVLIPQIIEIHLNPIVDNVIDRTGGAESIILTIAESTNLVDNYTIGGDLEEIESTLTGTILDATGDVVSNRPIVEIVATDASAFEGGNQPLGVFTISVRDRQGTLLTLTENLTVNFTLGPATSADIGSQDGAPADYILRSSSPSLLTNSIVIPAGQSSITLIVEPQDDGIPEEPEEFVEILLTTGFDYDQSINANTAIVSIVENEPAPFVPEVSITTVSTTASERTGGVGKFRVSRTIDGDEVNATTAKFLEGITLTLGGSASLNTDYNLFIVRPSGSRAAVTESLSQISILSGDEYVEIEVEPKQDQLPETSETVALSVTGGSPTTYLVNENQNLASVTITDGNIVSGVKVSVALASSFTDDQLIALGIDLANIAPRITGETLEEDSNEPRTVFIVSRSGGTTVDSEVTEDFNDDGVLDANDTRRSQALIVNLDTTTGIATPNEDYSSIAPTVTIPIGVDAVAIEVTPIGDTIADTGGDESVVVTIAPTATNSYAPLLDVNNQPSSASVFIIDNENNAPTLNAALLDDFVLNEDAGAVILRNASNRTLAQLVQDAFADEDINVPENQNETLKSIRFVTLPASGNLTLNGVLVTENQVLEFATQAQISEFLDSLRYQPDPDFFGQSEDLQSRPDRFKIVANDGFADSRETDVVINVRPVNDAPFYVLPGEDGFNGGSPTQPNNFYQDSAVVGNLAFSGGDTRNFALRPGVRVSIRDFVQGGTNEPDPVVGPQNERVSTANSALPAGNQTLTFSTTIIGDADIFDEAPTIAADGTLTFKLKDVIPGGFGTAQVRLSVKDNGGTANNGIDTLTKGFFIITGDENALSNVIQSFENPVGSTGSLIYNSTGFPVDSLIRVNLHQDVVQLGTSAYLDNIVGLYEIADPDGGIDIGKDLDGDGRITTVEEKAAKDGIADLTPRANMSAEDRAAYARGALENHLTNGSLQTFNLRAGSDGAANKNTTVTSFNRQGQSSTGLQTGVVIEGGKLYAPFIIANGGTLISAGSGGTIAGAIGTFLTAVNPNNSAVSNINSPVAYFSFSEVNPDGAEHLRYIRNESAIVNGQTQTIGIYGFEDLPGGGDRDYNDAVFGFHFLAPVIA